MSAVDQAEGLRRMVGLHLPRVLSLVSGRAGAGRTTLAVGLALALRREGRRVLVVDGNRRIGNACDALGLKPRYELAHALSGERALDSLVLRGAGDVAVLPAARGLQLLESEPQAHAAALARFARLLGAADVVLVDAANGECGALRMALRARNEGLITTSAGADAITRTYAWIKRWAPDARAIRLRVAICRAASEHEARAVFANLADACERHLGLRLQYLGALCADPRLARSRGAALDRGAGSAALRAMAARLFDDDPAATAAVPWQSEPRRATAARAGAG